MILLESLLNSSQSVLFVHAHPDDETLATGALIAELVARGSRVALLTASRGERGDVVPGPLSVLAGTAALTAERERELQCAADTLGISQHWWLGESPARADGLAPRHYRDSGMTWIRPGLAGPAEGVEATALTKAPLQEVIADMAALIAHLQPSLVISYDDEGGYGHPDHVRTREAALAACRTRNTPFAEILAHPGPGAEAETGAETDPDTRTRTGAPTRTQWFELARHLDTVTTALRCHASQLTVDGSSVMHSGGQRETITTSLGLRLV